MLIQSGRFAGYDAQLHSPILLNNIAWEKLTLFFSPTHSKREYLISPAAGVFKLGLAADLGANHRPRVQKGLQLLPPWDAEYILAIRALFNYGRLGAQVRERIWVS